MRPDKKKKQHHDSRKKAEKAKQGLASAEVGEGSGIGAKQDAVEESTSTPTSTSTSTPCDEKSSKESLKSTKLVESKPPKNISSNWTKYEIPSSDEDDSEVASTGLNFNFVLENAGNY